MSDIAWMRIERELWSSLDTAAPRPTIPPPRSRARYALPVVAVAALAALVVWAPWRGEPTSTALVDDGSPARVVSGESTSALSFGDAHITLDAHSVVVMTRDLATPTALLERGSAWFAIAPRQGRSPFVVTAGDVVVRVIGTKFLVARYAEEVVVEVERGTVEVQFHGTKLAVSAAQRWSSTAPGQTTSRTVTAAITTDDTAPDPVAPSTTAAPTPDVPATPTPDASAPPTTTTTTTKPTSTPSKPEPKAEVGSRPVKPETKPTSPVVDEDRAKFEALSQLEVRDPERAIAGYVELSNTKGPWASVALYSAARLAVDRGDRRAKDFLTAYLRRFPNGRNAADVRTLLDQLQGASR